MSLINKVDYVERITHKLVIVGSIPPKAFFCHGFK